MIIKTGHTIYEILESVDPTTNAPITGVSFDTKFFIDGTLSASIVPAISLANASTGTYSVSWSAITTGFHQTYIKNLSTQVIYISELYSVRPDNEVDTSPTIYVGL